MHRYFVRTSAKCVSLDALAETCEEKDGAFYTVTREISVADAHKLAAELKAADAGAFLAGVHAEV
jgi:hypothetical protein